MEKINKKELTKIFKGIKSGNTKSFNSLYELYYKLVYNIAFSVMKNKDYSEDVAQNVFEKIYKMSKQNLPENYEASWLYTVTKNEALQFIRKQKNDIDMDSIYEINQNDTNIDLMIDEDYYNSIMKKLNEKEKEIVTLKVVSGLTFNQISKILNMPIGTVQWMYYKSINVLKVSISTLTAVLITFIVGLTQVTKKENNEPEHKQINTNEKSADLSTSEKEDTNNIENLQNEINQITNQIVEVPERNVTINKLEHNKVSAYTLVGISIIILFVGIIIFRKVKNKIYKSQK